MKRWLTVSALTVTLVLAGCAPQPAVIEQGAADRLQQAVLTVSTSAHGNDLPGALASLDAVAAELEAAKVRGEVTEDRYLRISRAIEAVRAYLQQATAPKPAPAPAEDPDDDQNFEEEAPPEDTEEAPPAEVPEDEGDEGGVPSPTPVPSTTPTPRPSTTPAPTQTPVAPAAGAGAGAGTGTATTP